MSRESDIYIFTLKLKHCWGTKNGGDLTEGKAISNTEVHFKEFWNNSGDFLCPVGTPGSVLLRGFFFLIFSPSIFPSLFTPRLCSYIFLFHCSHNGLPD